MAKCNQESAMPLFGTLFFLTTFSGFDCLIWFLWIPGLDPAGIGYTVDYEGPPRGLNRTCCQHVQTIHTDRAIGSKQSMGHVDFFPNNATGIQPHCIIQTTGCSHRSVVEYYKAALNPANKFIGVSCGKLRKTAPNDACRFGPHGSTDCVHGSFCFDTTSCAPYTYFTS